MPLDQIPRLRLGIYPTPLIKSERLSQLLGHELWIKREDLSGFALGGNKVRSAEYLLGEALSRGSTQVIATGGPQSNHLRVIAAACAVLDLKCLLVMYGTKPDLKEGNYLLDHLFGAQCLFTGSPDRTSTEVLAAELATQLTATGSRVFLIPRGGGSGLGSLGATHLIDELTSQCESAGIQPGHLVLAAGSCGTISGMTLRSQQLQSKWQIWAISTSRSQDECRQQITRISKEASELLKIDLEGFPALTITDEFKGNYGKMDRQTFQTIQWAAQKDGLVVDPVFTGKALVGLRTLTHRQEISKGDPIVFIHSGGAPSLQTSEMATRLEDE